MKIYLDNNLGVTNVEQEELTQDTIGYNILKVYIPNAVLTPYDTFTCYYGALLQNGRKVGWFAMEARTNTDADYEANYTLYKATLEQCIVSVEGKVYIGCQVLLGNSGNATLIKKNTAVVQFNVRKSVAINNDILVLDSDQTTTDVLESYKNLLKNALTTYATKANTYTKTEVNSALALKADKSNTYTKTEVDTKLNLKADKTYVDTKLALKADKSDTYTKQEVNEVAAGITSDIDLVRDSVTELSTTTSVLEGQVSTLQNNTYTKTEVDEKLDLKADKTTVEGINTRVGALETDIADLESVQNVVDVVATKSALNSYDTSKLETNDKIQVIADESHDSASTIYNWNGSAWVYVGAFGGNSYTKAETYNKTQIDSALSDKADKSNTYTRTVIDSMILTLSTDKADKSTTYTKTEIDGKLEEIGPMFETLENEVLKKADKTDTYTKQEVNDKLDGYIKNDDTTYSATVRGNEVIVSTGAGYGSTTYEPGSIQTSAPRKPTCTYFFPDEKSGTFALTSDIKDPTITFTQGGVTKGSFSLNQSTDQTIELDAGGGSGGGSTVVANPTLSGNEETLEGAEIDGIKYKVGGGSKSYLHKISINFSLIAYGNLGYISLLITNSNNTPIGKEFFGNTLGYDTSNNLCYITGFIDNSTSSTSYKDKYIVIGFYITSSWKLALRLLTLSDLSIINVNSYYSAITDTVTEV